MNLIRIGIITLAVLGSSQAAALSWYQVEVIVFDRLAPEPDGETFRPALTPQPQKLLELHEAGTEPAPVPFMQLNEEQYKLAGIQQSLASSATYRPLIHLAWQQPATEKKAARYVKVQRFADRPAETFTEEPAFLEDLVAENQLLDGAVRIRSGFYLHVDVLMWYVPRRPEEEGSKTADAAAIDPVELKETRKIKLNEVHYFDHPLFGVILQVSRLEVPDAPVTETAVPAVPLPAAGQPSY